MIEGLEYLKKHIESYLTLPEAVWEEFQTHWKLRTFRSGEFLCQEGETEQYLYLVLQGVQRLYYLGDDAQEYILGFSFGHSISGVYDSFIRQQASRVFLQAISHSKLIGIHYQDMMKMMEKHRTIESWQRLMITDILIGRLEREVEILSHTARERYEKLLERNRQIDQLIPQKYLASYLGIAPETLSRIRTEKAQERN